MCISWFTRIVTAVTEKSSSEWDEPKIVANSCICPLWSRRSCFGSIVCYTAYQFHKCNHNTLKLQKPIHTKNSCRWSHWLIASGGLVVQQHSQSLRAIQWAGKKASAYFKCHCCKALWCSFEKVVLANGNSGRAKLLLKNLSYRSATNLLQWISFTSGTANKHSTQIW